MSLMGRVGRVMRETVSAFQRESTHREPEDRIADLLSELRRETKSARRRLKEREAACADARSRLAAEEAALLDCARRGEMAARIDDYETRDIARSFEARHRQSIVRLESTLSSLDDRCTEQRREMEARELRFRFADQYRFDLAARLRDADTLRRFLAAPGPFAALAVLENAEGPRRLESGG